MRRKEIVIVHPRIREISKVMAVLRETEHLLFPETGLQNLVYRLLTARRDMIILDMAIFDVGALSTVEALRAGGHKGAIVVLHGEAAVVEAAYYSSHYDTDFVRRPEGETEHPELVEIVQRRLGVQAA